MTLRNPVVRGGFWRVNDESWVSMSRAFRIFLFRDVYRTARFVDGYPVQWCVSFCPVERFDIAGHLPEGAEHWLMFFQIAPAFNTLDEALRWVRNSPDPARDVVHCGNLSRSMYSGEWIDFEYPKGMTA